MVAPAAWRPAWSTGPRSWVSSCLPSSELAMFSNPSRSNCLGSIFTPAAHMARPTAALPFFMRPSRYAARATPPSFSIPGFGRGLSVTLFSFGARLVGVSVFDVGPRFRRCGCSPPPARGRLRFPPDVQVVQEAVDRQRTDVLDARPAAELVLHPVHR